MDTPQDIYNHPKNVFVAGFIGSPHMNFINSKLDHVNEKLAVLFEGEQIILQDGMSNVLEKKGYVGKNIIIGIRPENIRIPGEKTENECLVFDMDTRLTVL